MKYKEAKIKNANGLSYFVINEWTLDNNKYMIANDYFITLTNLSMQSVPSFDRSKDLGISWDKDKKIFGLHCGMLSDGPSGPTIDTKNFMRGAFIHDGIYRAIRHGLIPYSKKPYADVVLYCVIKEDGMSSFRAKYVFLAVLKVGHTSCLPMAI